MVEKTDDEQNSLNRKASGDLRTGFHAASEMSERLYWICNTESEIQIVNY